LSEGKCLLNFAGNIEGRSDLISTNTTWVFIVKPGSKFQDGYSPTPTSSPSPTPTISPKPVPITLENDGTEEPGATTCCIFFPVNTLRHLRLM
jgi:hypothetical protein